MLYSWVSDISPKCIKNVPENLRWLTLVINADTFISAYLNLQPFLSGDDYTVERKLDKG